MLVDDVDVRDYPLEALRDEIGVVLQKNTLFSGTIRENLLWGNPDATQAEIESRLPGCPGARFHHVVPRGLRHRCSARAG